MIIVVVLIAEKDFQMLLLDLFQAGSDTTSTYLATVLLYLVLHPDVQEKILEEINNVISSTGEEVTVEDIGRMI
jgi:cytochrome P450